VEHATFVILPVILAQDPCPPNACLVLVEGTCLQLPVPPAPSLVPPVLGQPQTVKAVSLDTTTLPMPA